METADCVVVGGGIIGLSVARELKRRSPGAKVALLEKESRLAEHASGRNSGVLHAGFYYSADSLKARFTREGNRAMAAYCQERGLKLNRCGKLVVAQGPEDLPVLDELLKRGAANEVELKSVSEEDAREIEPRARTHRRAIFSPATCSIDPVQVVESLAEDALAAGVELRLGAGYLGRVPGGVRTTSGDIGAGFVVNCAGLYADKVARDFGFSKDYRILPFKGLYLYSDEPAGAFRTNIYPVPDLRNPFLGVHFTVVADGRVKIGPTAIPALWRENYGGWENFNAGELLEILAREAALLFTLPGFKSLALEELRKGSRSHLVALASRLASGVDERDYRSWGKPGIRAQLFDTRKKKLEMDFVIEGDGRSLHVLNAVSPAFTCALPFAKHVCDRIAR